MPRPPAPARAAGTSGQICLILVLGWAGTGAAWWSWAGFGSPLPGIRSWYYSMPGWVSAAAILGAFALLALWGVIPIVLLPVGLDHVRAAGPPKSRWPLVWAAIVAAGIMLEVLPFAVPLAFMSGAPNWNEFAESLAFAAVGTVMIIVLRVARRSPGPVRPGAPLVS